MTTDLESLKKNPETLRLYTQRLKLRKDGREYVGSCPFHSERTPSLKVFFHEGAWLWKCFGCQRAGNVVQFVEQLEKITFKAALEKVKEFLGQSWSGKKERVEETFREVAPQEEKPKVTYTVAQYLKYEQAMTPEALTWLKRERGITAETARRLHLGFRQDVGRIAGESNHDIAAKGWVAFPCIEGDLVVGIKYRSIARKAFCRQPGMRTALFNTETIDPLERVYLVEGELDAAALEQAGFRAVSLPSASTRVTPEMKDRLMQADELVLAGDCDGAVGSEIMEKLWTELQDRTALLKWPEGCKDANETFLKRCGGDVQKFQTEVVRLTDVAKSTPMPGVYSLQETMRTSGSTNLLDSPNRLHFPWPAVDKMAVLLPGSVAVLFATQTKQGKTAFQMGVSLHGALKHNEVVLNYQCELSTDEFSNIVAAHLLKKSRNHLTRADYVAAAKVMGSAKYYVGRNPTLTTVTPVLDLIEDAIRRLGVTLVVLDHIHFICRNERDEVQAQANAMQRFKNMMVKYKTKGIIVGQPRKANRQDRGKVVHITDAKGSETLTSDADAIYALHRNLIKVKDPKNPPKDDFDPKTEIHLLGARARGDGPTFAELMFVGDQASFYEITGATPPGGLLG